MVDGLGQKVVDDRIRREDLRRGAYSNQLTLGEENQAFSKPEL